MKTVMAEIPTDPIREREALIADAHAGDAHAQFLLGERYRIGDEFTERNDVEALKWYRLGAEQGNADAQCDLGSMYFNGTGTPKDAVQAAKWYRRAAEQGLAMAQFNLANSYLNGTGVERDDKEAIAWLLKAMAQDYGYAFTQLGTLYQLGRGFKQNFVTAAELHIPAAGAGDSLALANLSSYRNALEQIALGGSTGASVSMARIYDRGLGVPQDQPTALAWVRWARAHCTPEVDEHARFELEKLEIENVLMGTPDVESRAEALLAEMNRSSAKLPSRKSIKKLQPSKAAPRSKTVKTPPKKDKTDDEAPANPSSTPTLEWIEDDGMGFIIPSGPPTNITDGEGTTKPSTPRSRIVDVTEEEEGMGFSIVGGVRPPSKRPKGKT